MQRQRQYLDALIAQSRQKAAEEDSFISRAALKMTDYIVSDCSGNKLESLLQKVSVYDLDTILDLRGETIMGEEFLEFYPEENSVKEVVIDCFYERED